MSDQAILDALKARAGDKCELCGNTEGLRPHAVDPDEAPSAERSVLICAGCAEELGKDELDPKRFFGLKESIWSAEPAVQVLSYRLLHRLRAESWAAEQLEQVYLEDEVREWAMRGLESSTDEEEDSGTKTVDCNGNELVDGDSVTLVRNLDVKGAGFVAKQGTRVNDIRLTNNPKHIEGRINKVAIVLKTEFVKKA